VDQRGKYIELRCFLDARVAWVGEEGKVRVSGAPVSCVYEYGVVGFLALLVFENPVSICSSYEEVISLPVSESR